MDPENTAVAEAVQVDSCASVNALLSSVPVNTVIPMSVRAIVSNLLARRLIPGAQDAFEGAAV